MRILKFLILTCALVAVTLNNVHAVDADELDENTIIETSEMSASQYLNTNLAVLLPRARDLWSILGLKMPRTDKGRVWLNTLMNPSPNDDGTGEIDIRLHKAGTYAKVTFAENACTIIYDAQYKVYSWNENGERAQCMATLFTGHIKLQFNIKANGPTPLDKLKFTSKLHTLDMFDYKGNYLEDESLAGKSGIRVHLRWIKHSPLVQL